MPSTVHSPPKLLVLEKPLDIENLDLITWSLLNDQQEVIVTMKNESGITDEGIATALSVVHMGDFVWVNTTLEPSVFGSFVDTTVTFKGTFLAHYLQPGKRSITEDEFQATTQLFIKEVTTSSKKPSATDTERTSVDDSGSSTVIVAVIAGMATIILLLGLLVVGLAVKYFRDKTNKYTFRE